jgi:hypothetical protein
MAAYETQEERDIIKKLIGMMHDGHFGHRKTSLKCDVCGGTLNLHRLDPSNTVAFRCSVCGDFESAGYPTLLGMQEILKEWEAEDATK